MTNLKQLQESFQQYLLRLDRPEIICEILGTENLSATARLSIYSDAYQSRLIDALASNFPTLQSYLESNEFNTLATTYVDQNPSSFRSIRWLGDQFPKFIVTCPTYRTKPYLSELATLDWAMTLVFDAEDSNIITLNEISTIGGMIT